LSRPAGFAGFVGFAGTSLPPVSSVSSMTRVRWTTCYSAPAAVGRAAMASVVDEYVLIVGPVLVTLLSTAGRTTSGVVTAFTLATVGSC
jgi:hypothetical protein